MTSRGQAAIEFMVLLGFMILVFTTFFFVVQKRNAAKNEDILREELVVVAEIVEQEVLLAHKVQAGYERTFELPAKILGGDYTVDIHPPESPSEIVVRSGDFEYILFLQVNLSPSSRIAPGLNHIAKSEGANITIGEPPECIRDADCNDGKTCTDDSCQGGICNSEDTCGGGSLCETSGCTCFAGANGDQYTAGSDGLAWDSAGAFERSPDVSTAELCCDAATACAWDAGSECVAMADAVPLRSGNTTVCQPDAFGLPTWYRCESSVAGNFTVSGRTWCCSPTSGGDWLFNETQHPLKAENLACADGYDNDCDGLTDDADADCIDPSAGIVSACDQLTQYEGLNATKVFPGAYTNYVYNWSIGGAKILISAMPFDVPPLGGTIKDYAADALYQTTAAEGPGLFSDKGLVFDGDDVVNITTNAAYHASFAERTVALWYSYAGGHTASTEKYVLYEEGGMSSGMNIYIEVPPSGNGNVYAMAWSGSKNAYATAPISVTPGPQPIAAVFDGNRGQLRLYTYGLLRGQTPLTFNMSAHGKESVIGAKSEGTAFHDGPSGGSGNHFVGTIDEVFVFNRALSGDQVNNIRYRLYHVTSPMETRPGETWSVCVAANDGGTDGPTACSGSVTIIDTEPTGCYACPLPAPSGLTASDVQSSSATLAWTPGGPDGLTQRVYVGPDLATVNNNCSVVALGQACVVSEDVRDPNQDRYYLAGILSADTQYYVRVVNSGIGCTAEQAISFKTSA